MQGRFRPDYLAWKASVAQYQKPSVWRSSWQISNSLGALIAVWWLMAYTVNISWWLTAPLAVLAGGLVIRTFIIFHDCGHGSTFRSKTANSIWGFFCGLPAFTPYHRWRWEHGRHHATSGNLDRRGIGDIWTMTVQEYLDAPRWKRISYRVVRNPLVLFVIGPLLLMLILERIPSSNGHRRERQSVWLMNLAVGLMVAGLIAVFGVVDYVIIQLIILVVAGSSGVWLFYVQHQYEDTYWEQGEDWDYVTAALQGSSYYRLPAVLQWFSGNIGFHHIHHLNPRIPNYYLERCHLASPMSREVPALTLWSSLRSMTLHLWDEQQNKLVSFRDLRDHPAEVTGTASSPASER